jgi:signal transduction histidine kinase
MKNFFTLVIMVLLFSCIAHSQNPDDTIFHLKEFPAGGLILNRGWTFHPRDQMGYTKYDYNGKDGTPVNPVLLLDQLPVVKRSGIGWFRLKLQVDSSLRNKTIGMNLSMLGAAEIYLDGEQVYRFGNVSTNYSQEKTQAIYAQALNLRLGNDEKQILAVRYSFHPNNMYLKIGIIPFCLRIVLQPSNKHIDQYVLLVKQVYLFNAISLTIDLASALLTLFFFFSFPLRKEYLNFGLYFACQFLGVLVQSDLMLTGRSVQFSTNQLFLIQLLGNLLIITASFFYLNGMYALLQIRRTKFYKFLLLYAILSMIALPFLPDWGGMFPILFFPLTNFEILPAYYKAARRKFRGAWILFLSVLISLMSLAAMIKAVIENDPELITMSIAIALLTPALGLVIFLAGDFARTSSSLQSRIVEVEELSKKTLAQEKEKQEILSAQKDKLEIEVQERTAELSKSLADLKATQSQLIQSEKMASLGELTAGIAHEIQNPLNFVNNFSEVNKELLEEMKEEIENGNSELVKNIANDIIYNQEKITEHGKRADAIVKGMLQHSRSSSGVKEPTDINRLADEYLRLAHHGLRAKDKSFNATLKTDYDESIGNINIIPQDIGRVVLNLINN